MQLSVTESIFITKLSLLGHLYLSAAGIYLIIGKFPNFGLEASIRFLTSLRKCRHFLERLRVLFFILTSLDRIYHTNSNTSNRVKESRLVYFGLVQSTVLKLKIQSKSKFRVIHSARYLSITIGDLWRKLFACVGLDFLGGLWG